MGWYIGIFYFHPFRLFFFLSFLAGLIKRGESLEALFGRNQQGCRIIIVVQIVQHIVMEIDTAERVIDFLLGNSQLSNVVWRNATFCRDVLSGSPRASCSRQLLYVCMYVSETVAPTKRVPTLLLSSSWRKSRPKLNCSFAFPFFFLKAPGIRDQHAERESRAQYAMPTTSSLAVEAEHARKPSF